jgi:hypothetical protein
MERNRLDTLFMLARPGKSDIEPSSGEALLSKNFSATVMRDLRSLRVTDEQSQRIFFRVASCSAALALAVLLLTPNVGRLRDADSGYSASDDDALTLLLEE